MRIDELDIDELIDECAEVAFPSESEYGEKFRKAFRKGAKPLRERLFRVENVRIPHHAICSFKDGNQWCAVFGDFVNLQESPAGFGDTPARAERELQLSFNRHKAEGARGGCADEQQEPPSAFVAGLVELDKGLQAERAKVKP